MNQSDSSKESSISHVIGKLLDAWYETYFQLPSKSSTSNKEPKELNVWRRFLCAWLGSVTLFVPMPLFVPHIREALSIAGGSWQLEITALMWYVTGLASVFSLIIGCLIAWSRTPHGYVRLYLSGFVVTTFVVFMIYKVLTGDSPVGFQFGQ